MNELENLLKEAFDEAVDETLKEFGIEADCCIKSAPVDNERMMKLETIDKVIDDVCGKVLNFSLRCFSNRKGFDTLAILTNSLANLINARSSLIKTD